MLVVEVALLAFVVGVVFFLIGYVTHWFRSRGDRRLLARYRARDRARTMRVE